MMKDFWMIIKAAFTAVGAWLGYFLGGNDGLLYALLVFVIADYLTGVMCAIEDHKLSSAVGFRGLCRKVLTAVIFWAIANNGLSILENAAHLGLPVPEQLKAVLEQLHNRDQKSGEPEAVDGESVDE